MLMKTHIAITAFFILLFLSKVEHKLAFILIAFFVAFIPDIDSKFSILGKRKGFRILQFFVRHREIFHSFSFACLISLLFVLFFPIIALPFFLGYGLHLFVDSFTPEGIMPFYPYKKRVSGMIKNGSKFEILIFIAFIFFDVVLLFVKFFNIT